MPRAWPSTCSLGTQVKRVYPRMFTLRVFLLIFIYLFIYLVASGLSCSTRDLSLRCAGYYLQRAGFSLVVACGLSSCSMRASLPDGMWDLSSLTRDQTLIPCIGRWILNRWTTREVPHTEVLCVHPLSIPESEPHLWGFIPASLFIYSINILFTSVLEICRREECLDQRYAS